MARRHSARKETKNSCAGNTIRMREIDRSNVPGHSLIMYPPRVSLPLALFG